MRRIISSLTIVVFLFNLLGYSELLLRLRAAAGNELSQRLDTDLYDMGGTMTIKVPFHVPYLDYIEPDYLVNTEVEREGEIFRVIKQRHYNDTLYMVCIKDDVSTRINNTLVDFVQSFAGEDSDSQNIKTNLIKDYLTTVIGLSRIENGWEQSIVHTHVFFTLPNVYTSTPARPPSVMAFAV